MLIFSLLFLSSVMVVAVVLVRVFVRRPLSRTDLLCAAVDADLDARATRAPSAPVVAERRAA